MKYRNNNFKLLKDAYRSLKKNRYKESIVILKRLEESGDIYISFLLAVAFFYSDDFSKADFYIQKVKAREPLYLPLVELETFLFLKYAKGMEPVLTQYIDLIQEYPGNKNFIRAMSHIHKSTDFKSFQKNAKLNDFVTLPSPTKDKIKKNKVPNGHRIRSVDIKETNKKGFGYGKFVKYFILSLFFAAVFVSLGFLIYSFLINKNNIPPQDITSGKFKKIDMVNLSGSKYEMIRKVNKKKTPVFYYTYKSMEDDFYRAKKLIKAEKYNNGLIILNKIYNSNAGFNAREKVDFLIKFIMDRDERSYEVISFNKLSKSGYLYRGYSLNWKGKVANLKFKNGKTIFNLLVNYNKDNTFSGVADIFSGKELKELKNGDIINLKGIFINNIGSSNKIYISADRITIRGQKI